MPKLQLFEIELENPSGVYYAGNVVAGRVIIQLSEEMKMREVRLKLVGRAKASWTDTRQESHTMNGKTTYTTHTDHYTGEQKYFDQKITLSANPTLPAGMHTFPFNYKLPSNCPTSFEGSYGNIRYIVGATIDRPWRFDHNTKRAFTVVSWMDLNADPGATQPRTKEDEKTLGCWCCVAGKITWNITLPKTGYVPGELVTVTGEVANNSSRYVDMVRMRIIQNVTFRASCGSGTDLKKSENVLAEMVKPSVNPRGTQIWNNEGLRLPPVPLSTPDDSSAVIDIYYNVEFHIVPSGPSFNVTFTLPITVGSVPLRQQMAQFQQEYRQFSVDGGVAEPGGIQPTAPDGDAYPDLPPPSYVEATTDKVDIKEDDDNEYTRGQLRYAPRYPYYGWTNIPSSQTASAP